MFLTCSHLLNAKTINHSSIATKKVENPSDKQIKENYLLKTGIIELTEENETMLENEKNYLYSLILSGTADNEQIKRYNELSNEINIQKNIRNNVFTSLNNWINIFKSMEINEFMNLLENYINSKIQKACSFRVSESGNIYIIEQ